METVVNLLFLQQAFSGRKVFLTGHTGFKGSWAMALLRTLGATVKGYALAPEYADGLYDLLLPEGMAPGVLADIRDKDRLRSELLDFAPDYIFHLAAQPLVRRSYEIPAETFDINAIGTANLLEAVQALPGKCTVLVITTDKVYENVEKDLLYRETDRLGGYDPYSASKACTELVVSSFHHSFFNPQRYAGHQKALATVRAGNVIGGGDWSRDRIIPDIVRALQQEQPVLVRNPHAVRPWQHVLEPLCGYLLLAARLNDSPKGYATAYNFGPEPDDHLMVKEVVDIALQTWGSGSWKDASDSNAVHEAGLLKLNITRAKEELHWQPRLHAADAVAWTINWYKQPVAARLSHTFAQIKTFLAL
jgi:CDP-glucose 4,6-dehydratase